jgi:hypothetical protein
MSSEMLRGYLVRVQAVCCDRDLPTLGLISDTQAGFLSSFDVTGLT